MKTPILHSILHAIYFVENLSDIVSLFLCIYPCRATLSLVTSCAPNTFPHGGDHTQESAPPWGLPGEDMSNIT